MALSDRLEEIFAAAGCEGSLRLVEPATGLRVDHHADKAEVAASVIKVLIALRAEIDFCVGHLDPHRAVRLSARHRTPGPVGFSLYEDDVTVSARDLVVSTLTISDNVAADAVLDLVGLDRCNELADSLGLTSTRVVSSLDQMIHGLVQGLGWPDWDAFSAAREGYGPDRLAELDQRIRASAALDPERATRTSAADMTELLAAIWSDRAGPPAACARIRELMGRQLTTNRLARGFPTPARVAAKSGGLLGVVRHEVGTVETQGRLFHVAVMTRAQPGAVGERVDRAIGRAAAAAAVG